jgi:4-alpha-glucanotransferase
VIAAGRVRTPAALLALAAAAGVQRSYTDPFGRRRTASPEALAAVLRALGHDVEESGRGADEALRALEARRRSTPAGPVAVSFGGAPRVALTAGADAAPVRFTIVLESGGQIDGKAVPEGSELPLPAVPDGYHRVHLRAGRREATTLLLCAPRRAYAGPDAWWGVFLPVYALPGPFGPGDFTRFRRLAEWVRSLGGLAAGTTPLHAAFLAEPFDPSPYAPVSRLYWNELYVDPQAVPELAASPRAQELLERLPPTTAGDPVDYRAAAAAKRRVLEALLASLGGPRRDAFEGRLGDDPGLADYAAFRARCERERGGWREWTGAADPAADAPAARYHAYAQWLCAEQLGGVAAYLDMPLGVHPSGYDTWRHREAFAEDVSVGAPPDGFFVSGQDWGFAPLHPGRVRESGYAYPIACVRELLRRSVATRIDHVMGLHRTFWVPHGLDATEGVYVRSPAEELYAVLTIESHRHRTMLVGEDLGTVPDVVRRRMTAHGLMRTFALQAEVDAGPDLFDRVPRDALAGMNTHDMPTFAAFWESAPRDVRERLRAELAVRGHAAADGPDVLDGCLRELARSPARGVLVSLEDMWWEREPQNVPGTSSQDANWRRPSRYDVEQLPGVPGLEYRLRELTRLRESRP